MAILGSWDQNVVSYSGPYSLLGVGSHYIRLIEVLFQACLAPNVGMERIFEGVVWDHMMYDLGQAPDKQAVRFYELTGAPSGLS